MLPLLLRSYVGDKCRQLVEQLGITVGRGLPGPPGCPHLTVQVGHRQWITWYRRLSQSAVERCAPVGLRFVTFGVSALFRQELRYRHLEDVGELRQHRDRWQLLAAFDLIEVVGRDAS